MKIPISNSSLQIQEKADVGEEDLESFPKFGNSEGYPSSRATKNKLLHKPKRPGKKIKVRDHSEQVIS